VRTQETKEDRECQVCLRRDKYIPDRDRLTVEFCFTAVSLFLPSFFYLRRVMLVPPHSFCSSLRLSTRSHSKEVKNFACLRVPRYLLQGQDMVSFLLMINMTCMIMAGGLNFSGRECNMLSLRYLQMMTCMRTERAGRCV